MIHQIFTVYDAAAEAFLQPFFAPTIGSAIRMFSDICEQPDHQFAKHPEDYTLFHIGVYDDSSADIEKMRAPVKLGSALELTSKPSSSEN